MTELVITDKFRTEFLDMGNEERFAIGEGESKTKFFGFKVFF